ncbi:hypothetical protein D9757_005710 [Collybiopsis confluens]|uniref:F-box domain-containing protein n=1 Tax=Collybiopsis confluens TaxID=2823264 RepID=A0A8H5HPQ8_9AGAR|nr:hypothetical protein D9757_005710 [Collybiopsis confluens]
MHEVLLIDELLEVVLGFCTDSATLSRIARTCQAWKEPALDRVWARLDSFLPLLRLIPGLFTVNGVYLLESPIEPGFRRLRHYASRVRTIASRQNIRIHPSLLSLLLQDSYIAPIFYRLSSVQLSLTNCHAICPLLSLSPELKKVDLDLGFKTKKDKAVNKSALQFISTVGRLSAGFTSLSLRGTASSSVLKAVTSLPHLNFLYLRNGVTFTADTLAAIATFPSLKELKIQISHLHPESLRFPASACFPSLQLLDIRGRTTYVEKLLLHMQSDCLVSLRVEVEHLWQTDDTWDGLFNAIRHKTRTTLQELTIEHIMDADDLFLEDGSIRSPDTLSEATTIDNIIPPTNPSALLLFDHLYSLSNHNSLHRLLLETTPPIIIQDQDLEKMVQWWPNLEHLDLGTLLTEQRWAPKTTPAALFTISRGFSALRSLVMPVNISGLTHDTAIRVLQTFPDASSLHHITLTALTPPNQSMAHLLYRLFPSLRDIHGTRGHEEAWTRVQDGFHLLRA